MSEFMEKVKSTTCKMDMLSDLLMDALNEHLDGTVKGANSTEIGAVIDMIKDLSVAKEKAVKSIYYEAVGTAMETGDVLRKYTKIYDDDPTMPEIKKEERWKYYDEPISKFEHAKAKYDEAAAGANMDHRASMAQAMMDALIDEMAPYTMSAEPTEKSIIRNAAQKIINKFS